jgi:thiamine biosynthesis protein ThiI
MQCTGAVCDFPVLRPVVGMDKEEIVRVARRIGTFDTSILPHEDCSQTVFTPRHPRINPAWKKSRPPSGIWISTALSDGRYPA